MTTEDKDDNLPQLSEKDKLALIEKMTDEEKRRKMWQLRMRGMTLEAIGKLFGVTRQTVSHHLDKLKSEMAEQFRMGGSDALVVETLLALEYIRKEAFEQAASAEAGSPMKYNYLDLAARRTMEMFSVYKDAGMVEKKPDEIRVIAEQIAGMSHQELKAKAEEMAAKLTRKSPKDGLLSNLPLEKPRSVMDSIEKKEAEKPKPVITRPNR